MRKFRLINGQGERFELNRKDSFFHDIKGFGFEDATQYEQIGHDFYPLEEILSQGKIEGKILFAGKKPYETYREFARFIRSTPLTLVYQPDEVFRVPVRIATLGKEELSHGGAVLVSEISFVTQGLFYKSITKYSNTLSVGGKIYPYTYDYAYSDVSYNSVEIESDSYEDSPCKITIHGPCMNPIWKHYVNNVLYETGAYVGTISGDHKLVIDTTKMPYSITERGAGDEIVADRYQLCDFSTERFFHLRHGSNRISVTHEGINTLKVIVEGRINYETV